MRELRFYMMRMDMMFDGAGKGVCFNQKKKEKGACFNYTPRTCRKGTGAFTLQFEHRRLHAAVLVSLKFRDRELNPGLPRDRRKY